MSARKASLELQRIAVSPALVERAQGPVDEVDEVGEGAEWQGAVRLDAARASGISAASWQSAVRTGLLERVLVLGAEHREGPHGERPEVGRRLLAHLDALAEAGLSFEALVAFADEAELGQPGAAWALTLVSGSLELGIDAGDFAAWVESLEEELFAGYTVVEEIAAALGIVPNAALRQAPLRWIGGASAALAAIGLESALAEQVPDALVEAAARDERPLVRAAFERFCARMAKGLSSRARWPRAPWSDLEVPALCFEVARARLLQGDREPLLRLRAREARALAALGPFAIDLLALAGDGGDGELARDRVLGFPSSAGLVEAMGRVGVASLLPRLLADLGRDEVRDEAQRALVTMLGPGPERPSVAAWEQVIGNLPEALMGARLRGGKAHALASVLEESRRPELSERELFSRAAEVCWMTGKRGVAGGGRFGVSLEGLLAELARVAG